MVTPELDHDLVQLALAENLPVLGGRDRLQGYRIDVVRESGQQFNRGLLSQREQRLDRRFEIAIIDAEIVELLFQVGVDADALYRGERVAVYAEAGAFERGVLHRSRRYHGWFRWWSQRRVIAAAGRQCRGQRGIAQALAKQLHEVPPVMQAVQYRIEIDWRIFIHSARYSVMR